MRIGIFGFPKVGKTTLFNLLTRLEAATDKFSSGRAAPNVGVARVADPRVDRLVAMYKPKKTTYATVTYVDVVGLERGELKDSVDLKDLRPVDALVHVVRAFDDDEIDHAPGPIDPARDIQAIEEECLLADLISVEGRLERLEADLRKRKDEALSREQEALLKVKAVLDEGEPARTADLEENQVRLLRGFQFLSAKPILHVINLGEERQELHGDVIGHFGLGAVDERADSAVTYVLGKLEMEISELDEADAAEFLRDLGLTETGTDRISRTSYDLLGLISFFTVGEDEVRAWTIRKGTNAGRAAGTIHSDLERGFVRAEVTAYDDLIAQGSEKACKDAKLQRLEHKTYIVQDGEIVHVRSGV